MIKNIVLIVAFIFLISCEGYKTGAGIVYDKSTNKPLDSVRYYAVGIDYIEYTDSLGKYYVEGKFGGCVSECPDFDAEFSKPGYKTITLKNPNGDVYLELEEK
ncbi:hypothetical protein BD847_1598 [Flavobacterium cutihirudinis]|uniref:Lipoprotein n=1 Tax=Flavobacterium cutihirudinis TaxID=1265740 RepID=A0A3D9FXK9_9FLAO|nr:hypothetical protein [Flavobacterium cutihirudinis]RED24862.1 hypothetical protein BD847_1598 [Flavobacterium cutihirudinis]